MISKATTIGEHKLHLGMLPTISAEVPEFIYIATNNARCNGFDLYIKEGDHVKVGQVIGMRHAGFFDQPVHSTVSGTFVGYEKHYHRSGKMVDFIKIQNDHLDEWDENLKPRTDEEIAQLNREDFVRILKDFASVGLGGSSFPTYIKFQTEHPIKTILINGIECEPFITADKRLMADVPEQIIDGMMIVGRFFDCKDIRLCVKSKYKEIIEIYNEILRRYPDSGIKVCPVGNFFPQGWEVAMIKSATGISVPSGHLPMEYGILDFNVSTCHGIYQAVRLNRPVVERYISVSGNGVRFPSNFKVRVGTPIQTLLDRCGGYAEPEKEKVFILGGPMMGASVPSDDCIITKTVTSVIIMNAEKEEEQPCIRCGSCVLSCPTHLEPKQIMDAVKANDRERIKALRPLTCIECGLCTYVCTSHIRVTDYIRRAKILAKLP